MASLASSIPGDVDPNIWEQLNIDREKWDLLEDWEKKKAIDAVVSRLGGSAFASVSDVAQVVFDISENFPVVGAAFSLCRAIYEVTQKSSRNKKNCLKVTKRCHAIETIIGECAKEYKRLGGPTEGHRVGLERLKYVLDRLKGAVDTYLNRGRLRRMFSSTSFKEVYEELDRDIADAITLVQLGLSTTIMGQNNDLLERTKYVLDVEKAKEEIDGRFENNEIDGETLKQGELLGQGGQAAVYKFTQGRYERAGKVFTLSNLVEKKREKIMKGVKKELALMCRVDRCENVVRVFGVAKISDQLILIMEYANQGSLRDYLDNHNEDPLPKDLVLNIINDIAVGMKEIYKHGVEHRDLKADNVFLDENHGDLIAKVGDFGISKCKDLMTHVRNTTVGGDTGGTFPWKAPERFEYPFPFDQKCDVYSFAIVIWEIFTREAVWGNLESNDNILLAVTQGRRPPLDEGKYVELYGGDLLDILKRCWEQDPDDRPTFVEVVESLPKSGKKILSEQAHEMAHQDAMQNLEERLRKEYEEKAAQKKREDEAKEKERMKQLKLMSEKLREEMDAARKKGEDEAKKREQKRRDFEREVERKALERRKAEEAALARKAEKERQKLDEERRAFEEDKRKQRELMKKPAAKDDWTKAKVIKTLTGHSEHHSGSLTMVNPDILACGGYGDVKLWDWKTGAEIKSLKVGPGYFDVLCLCMVNADILACCVHRTISLVNWKTGVEIKSMFVGTAVHVMTMLNADILACDGRFSLWNWKTGTEIKTRLRLGNVCGLTRVNADIVAISQIGTGAIILWEWKTDTTIRSLFDGSRSKWTSLTMVNTDIIASGSELGSIKLWNWKTGEEIKTLIIEKKIIPGKPYPRVFLKMVNADILASMGLTYTFKWAQGRYSRACNVACIVDLRAPALH
eukprot:Stramenopile-MAST_4_protein_2845